jgi:hypothetical protein
MSVTEVQQGVQQQSRARRRGDLWRGMRTWQDWRTLALGAGSLLALAGFAWPFFAVAAPAASRDVVPWIALALVPALVVVFALALDQHLSSAKLVALLGVLAAVGIVVRLASLGLGGVEAVFIVLIVGGRAFGARFGFLLGLVTILVSGAIVGGIGPWTPFQMCGAAWVGAGAGLLPRLHPRGRELTPTAADRRREVALLMGYGVLAAYLFGALMNLWFWPFAVGTQSSLSYVAGAPLPENISRFGVYTLVTSTLTWDTVRAIVTATGLALAGGAALAALRRVKL